MNQILLSTLFLICTVATFAQTDGAVLTFEKEKHDFGNLKQGEEATFDFIFTNTGTKNLIITDVVGSCSCTASNWPKEPIAPGQKAVITATYDTKDKSGTFNKSLTITANASEETKRIYIKGNVIADGETTQSGSGEKSGPTTQDE